MESKRRFIKLFEGVIVKTAITKATNKYFITEKTLTMKIKTLFIAVVLLMLTTTISAQNYNTGIGARVGFFNGLTVKHFVSPNNAVEGILNFRWGGAIITGMYEWQNPIPNAPGFDYYLGVGAHVGFFDTYKWDHSASTIVGADVVVGAEYTFPTAPFTIGIDYKPAFNFIGDSHIWADGLALNLRFNIN